MSEQLQDGTTDLVPRLERVVRAVARLDGVRAVSLTAPGGLRLTDGQESSDPPTRWPLGEDGAVLEVVGDLDDRSVEAVADLARWATVELAAAQDQDRDLLARLDALQRRTALVLSSVAEGVVGVDADGAITFVNAAARELLGWPAGAFLGADLHAVSHARHVDGTEYPAHECPVTEVLRSGRRHPRLHGTFWRYDGTALRTDWSAGPIVDEGAVVGAVVVFGDATQRLRMEDLKDSFTSVVSHELRTPLTSLKGALDLLDSGVGGPLGEQAERLLGIGLRNAHRLARLVDDILDVERSARGEMPMARRPIDAEELMGVAASTVQGMAVARGIHIQVDPLDATVWGDEHRLIQVLTNLLGNALRFSPEGSTIRVHGEHDPSAVRISVTDQGMGIPPDQLDRVFERFWQADASSRRQSGGTGLGLAIAKNIVEAHGGRIVVTSTEGQGSTFTVCLPLRSRRRAVPVERRRGGTSEPAATRATSPTSATSAMARLDRVPEPRGHEAAGTAPR